VSVRRDDDTKSNITHGSASMRGRRESGRNRPGSGCRCSLLRRDNGTKRLRVILPGRCWLSKPTDYCHSNKYPLWVSAIDENARSLRPGFLRVNLLPNLAGAIAGFFRKSSESSTDQRADQCALVDLMTRRWLGTAEPGTSAPPQSRSPAPPSNELRGVRASQLHRTSTPGVSR
jgi:hypothetical protein